jgi:predicted DNA-binding protein (MmcQ/YjbR family)
MTTVGKPDAATKKAADQIRKYALQFPETHEDHPWGHSAFKVKAKTFIFMGADESGLSLSIKLRESLFDALACPFSEPTHYGLGKHGWVTATFAPGDAVPMDMLKAWIDESFREIAPKTILKKYQEQQSTSRRKR